MDLTTFLNQRRPEWRRLEEILARVEGSGLATLDDDQAVEFGRLYRRAASDLNQAQTFVSGEATVQYLNDLVARCYLVIYAKTKIDLRAAVRYFLFGFPVAFRRNLGYFLFAVALLAVGAVFGFLASYFDPDVARRLPASGHAHDPAGRRGDAADDRSVRGVLEFPFHAQHRRDADRFRPGRSPWGSARRG